MKVSKQYIERHFSSENGELGNIITVIKDCDTPILLFDPEGQLLYSNNATIASDKIFKSIKSELLAKVNNSASKTAELSNAVLSTYFEESQAYKVLANTISYNAEECYLIQLLPKTTHVVDLNTYDFSVSTHLKNINDNLSEAIYRSNPSGKIIYANKRFLELFGYKDLKHLQEERAENLYARGVNRDIIENKLNEFGEVNNEKVQFRNKNGIEFWGLMNTKVVIENGKPYYDGTIRKVKSGQTVEELLAAKNTELEKTNAQLDRFLYSTSHDLRAPLTSIMGLVNLMKIENSPESINNYIEQITYSAKKLDNVIMDMLSFTRNKKQKVESKKIDLEKLVNDVLLEFQTTTLFEKIDFIINVNERLPFYCDPYRIRDILYHLIKNAISFADLTKEKSYIRVDVSVYGNKAIIEVVDNGIGIPRKYLDNIFEMFFRGTDRSKGSGLGLYIVKETMLKLSGKLTVDSDVGHGTIFLLEIPNGIKGKLKAKKLKLYGDE